MESQEIGGRYSVIERIGKGAMGVVFKAYDPVLDRVVAIKKMVAEIGQDEELRQRFYVEARAAARLNHRNIVTIHELEEADGEIYIVMELLEGVDLASVIRRKVPLPLDARLSIVSQLCEGLDYAHRYGIVHRDIKPGNVHLSPAGLVKIVDFGIARLASSKMTGTGALLGTPDYMSPEQVMGEDIDARSDLFAVGGVLYELLAGAKAFESDSVASLLIKIAKNPHVPITDRVPDLPVSLVSLVNRLLAKDREQRPPSAGAVVAELRACLLSITGGSDTAAAAAIGGMVTEQTIAVGKGTGMPAHPMPGTPRPGTPRPPRPSTAAPRDAVRTAAPTPAAADTAAPPASSTSNARLASLALQRGRELRKAGDLAGAIQVFRSVLEVAPGNPEALEELQAVETDIRQATARPKTATGADNADATVLNPPARASTAASVAAPAPVATPAATASVPSKGKSRAGLAVAATLVLAIAGATGAGYYLLVKGRALSNTAEIPATTSVTAPAAQASAPPATSSVPASAGESAPANPAPAVPAPPTAAANPSAPEPAAPATSVQDAGRIKAEIARTRLETVKRVAAGRRPPPPPVRREFMRAEREGDAAYARGDFARAAVAYDEAAQAIETALNRRAENAAANTPAAPPPANPGAVVRDSLEPRRGDPPPPPRPGPPASPARAEDPAPMRPAPASRDASPGDISTFTRGAPTTVDQMFNATPSAAASVARVKDLIERYAKGIEQRDGEALRTTRGGELNPLEQRILRQGRQVSYRLDDVNVQTNGQEAVATARRTVNAELQSGEKITTSGQVSLRLVRRASGWVITDIR